MTQVPQLGPRQAVLLIAFGGPERPEEIRPFLQHVLRGRPVPASRIEEVAHHYELIGGRSPINELIRAQRAALTAALAQAGSTLPVQIGNRHATPFLADTLRELADSGARDVIGVVMASWYDRATLERYGVAVREALQALAIPDLNVRYATGPDRHPGFITANVERIQDAYATLPAPLRAQAKLVFTAHSVPSAIGASSGYVSAFESAAQRIASALALERTQYRLAYQSRSGAPSESWLEPDIVSAIRDEAQHGTSALVIAPIGFVCDHVEVLYDLDIEAAQVATSLGVQLARAGTVGTHPAYIAALAAAVTSALAQPLH